MEIEINKRLYVCLTFGCVRCSTVESEINKRRVKVNYLEQTFNESNEMICRDDLLTKIVFFFWNWMHFASTALVFERSEKSSQNA